MSCASNNREDIKRKNEIKITKLTLSMNINYLLGNFPNTLASILNLFVDNRSSLYGFFNNSSLFFGFFAHSTYLLIYYNFNLPFKKEFIKEFQRISKIKKVAT